MSQSRKTIKEFSAIYLDGLRLDTNSSGNLTLAGNEIGTGGGSVGDHLAVQTATIGNLTIPVIEGAPSYINDNGLASFQNLNVNDIASFQNLNVNGIATIGSLAIGTVEGTIASIDESGVLDCTRINFALLDPKYIVLSTQGTSITTPVENLNSQFGSVLTVSSNLATQGSVSFDVSNVFVYEESKIICNIVKYNGTGLPSVYVSNVTSGAFTVTLQNNSITQSLNSSVEIGFICLGLSL
jgi:hypothetical protein